MDDMKLKNNSWEETKERIAEVYQSGEADLLEGMVHDPKESPQVERTRYELIFQRFTKFGTELDDEVRSMFEQQAEEHSNAYCRRLIKATLAVCTEKPTDEQVEALRACADDAENPKVRSLARELLMDVDPQLIC